MKSVRLPGPMTSGELFTGSGIRLKQPECDNVADFLLDYPLWSEEIHLGYGESDTCSRFFASVLLNQQETLEELTLIPRFRCRWCFGFAIAKCTKLKHVFVFALTPYISSYSCPIQKLLTDTVIIVWVYYPLSQRLGRSLVWLSAHALRGHIFDSVERFRPSCWHLPLITVGSSGGSQGCQESRRW